jgi:abortive infection bacteriophage resistance protein
MMAKIQKIYEPKALFFKKYLEECENLRNFAAQNRAKAI